MIKGCFRRKTILKSSFILLLSLSIFFSSISISFAGVVNIPEPVSPIPVEDLVLNASALEWVSDWCEQDSDGQLWVAVVHRGSYDTFFLCFFSSDVSIYTSSSSCYANSTSGFDGIYYSTDNNIVVHWDSGKYPTNVGNITLDGVVYHKFNIDFGWSDNQTDFYCSSVFKDPGGDVSANLDLSSYLAPPYIFLASLTEDKDFIEVTVNFNPSFYDSCVHVWGYDEFGPTQYVYPSSSYLRGYSNDELFSFFLDITELYSHFYQSDFTIQEISIEGWEDLHEEFLTVSWQLSAVKEPSEYDPPDTNYYYSSFYNENYSYNSDNGNNITFGYDTLYCGNGQYWNFDLSLVQPFRFSVIFLPPDYENNGVTYHIPQRYITYLFDTLALSYDVIILDCNADVFNYVYSSNNLGLTALIDFYLSVNLQSDVDFAEDFTRWYKTHLPSALPLSYSFIDRLPTAVYSDDVGILFTDSFYYRSLSYLLGDTDDRLLEFSTRFFEEDGFSNTLLKGLSSIYVQDRGYYSEALTYLNQINFFTEKVLREEYFPSIINLLTDIKDEISSFDDDLSVHLPLENVADRIKGTRFTGLWSWINSSISDFGDTDFSTLSSLYSSIQSIFISVAPDGDFIDNIDQPLTFGDNVGDVLFPDD